MDALSLRPLATGKIGQWKIGQSTNFDKKMGNSIINILWEVFYRDRQSLKKKWKKV
jgi:hypothetical protein